MPVKSYELQRYESQLKCYELSSGQAERSLSEQGAQYDACVCRRQQLEGAVKRASGRLQRCTRLATVLADEYTRWQKFVKVSL